ncbi:hypothetical protein [Prolixibacter denitrificans]|uniref:Oligosaccharide repeat unit polymerase n=1 Tax=Prolixibacter denitrificans TaxID=1541063 RepID=A0A2P8CDU1_9BACT|nr:hypothetical protein [Prolixibacter denitrificans]PSK83130.1 hypothetical protein CLV93_10460 [Prolixibacter denitrificans]GET21987.1 hypothetical protein JCM18694_22330 [Prolixibacter denitrificans]
MLHQQSNILLTPVVRADNYRERYTHRFQFTLAVFITAAIQALVLYSGNVPIHWFLVPVDLIGILVIYKIINIASKSDYLSHVDFYAYIIFFNALFLAPNLHFLKDFWLPWVPNHPVRWDNWVLIWALLNLIGLIIFIVIRELTNQKPRLSQGIWIYNPNRNYIIVLFMIVSFAAQVLVYARFGGVSGYIYAYETARDTAFKGMGYLFTVSEIFPILFIIWFFLNNRGKKNISSLKVYLFFILLFAACIYFGGLKGRRSNTIFTMFHGFFLVHLYIYRFKFREIVLALVFGMLFMLIGKVYKFIGFEAVILLSKLDFNTLMEYNASYGNGIVPTLIGDFGRCDVQSFAIYRNYVDGFPHYWGLEYFGDLIKMFPSVISDHFTDIPSKIEVGESYLYGSKTRIFGVFGEYIFNFGISTAYLAYVIFAAGIMLADRFVNMLRPNDIRLILVPLIFNLIIIFFLSDLDNVGFFFFKRMLIPILLIWIISEKHHAKQPT